MDKQNQFAGFIGQRTKSLLGRINEVDHKRSNEHIRRVRVGIKRWRTLYHLVTVLLPNLLKHDKVERSIQRLFKRAGNVRDCQLNRQLLTKVDLPTKLEKKFLQYVGKQERKARKRLKKAINLIHKKRVRKISRRIGQLSSAISPDQISRQLINFMDQEARSIEVLIQPDASPEQLHRIRKHLKSLIETGHILGSITPDKSLTRLMQGAKNWQRRLGNWHDQVSLIEQLNGYLTNHSTEIPPEKLRSLIDQLEAIVHRQTTRIRHDVAQLSQLIWLLSAWRTLPD